MREGYALPPPASATPPRRLADLLWSPGVHTVKEHDAGWSSSVARWAHNPEVAGSNPAPATKVRRPDPDKDPAFCVLRSCCCAAACPVLCRVDHARTIELTVTDVSGSVLLAKLGRLGLDDGLGLAHGRTRRGEFGFSCLRLLPHQNSDPLCV